MFPLFVCCSVSGLPSGHHLASFVATPNTFPEIKPGNEDASVPLAIALTEFHVILLYKRMYRAICLLNNKRVCHLQKCGRCIMPEKRNPFFLSTTDISQLPHQVVEELFPVSKVGDMMGIARDVRMQTVYAYSR